jgi:predicted  nucleic acid-binding Zn-ribbon protein
LQAANEDLSRNARKQEGNLRDVIDHVNRDLKSKNTQLTLLNDKLVATQADLQQCKLEAEVV